MTKLGNQSDGRKPIGTVSYMIVDLPEYFVFTVAVVGGFKLDDV